MEQEFDRAFRWGLGVAGLGAIASFIGVPRYGMWISIAILFLAAIFIGVWILWKRRRARKREQTAQAGIHSGISLRPRGISDGSKLAKIEELRSSFQRGLKDYESKGHSVYKSPWYLFVGEPGSGKTEAVRRSGIKFPAGLNNVQQGAGGTINMNWWFSSQAVILDTAGRLMFEEINPGQNNEWLEFLKLLRKARPRCPINGLVLCLPIDSLLRATPEEIANNANVIAQQFANIQGALDVRFPVYVLVTKCDKLKGFREFFDDLRDPKQQFQVFGWSNPDDLDRPFRPELVAEHLDSVAEKLRRRRYLLLRDPVAEAGVDGRRLDEVDSMFAFPDSILKLSDRLRLYLESIFADVEMCGKPLFLRGIYFTSALQQGEELDEAVANILGVPVAELTPPDDANAQILDRALFLRDLFTEKVFKEQGLVTSANNIGKMLKARQIGILGGIAGALLLLVVVAWIGYSQLEQTILKEARSWRIAASGWPEYVQKSDAVKSAVSHRVLGVDADGVTAKYVGDESMGKREQTVAQFHFHLQKLASTPLQIGWVFKPMVWLRPNRELDRKAAQAVVFENGIVRPVLYNVRSKIVNGSLEIPEDTAALHSEALRSLIRLEADKELDKKHIEPMQAGWYLAAWIDFLVGASAPEHSELKEVFAWTFGPEGKGVWPPEGTSAGGSLAENRAIARGIDQFFAHSAKQERVLDDRLNSLNVVRDSTSLLKGQELLLHELAQTGQNVPSAEVAKLKTQCGELDAAITNVIIFSSGKDQLASLQSSYQNLQTDVVTASGSAIKQIISGSDADGKLLEFDLFREITAKFLEKQGRLVQELEGQMNKLGNQELVHLDDAYLKEYSGRTRKFSYRCAQYDRAATLGRRFAVRDESLIGSRWTRFVELGAELNSAKADIGNYSANLAEPFKLTCNNLLASSQTEAENRIVGAYQSRVSDYLNQLGRVDYQQVTADRLRQERRQFFDKVEDDLREGNQASAPVRFRPILSDLQDQVERGKVGLAEKYVENRRSELKRVASQVFNPDVKKLDELKAVFQGIEGEVATIQGYPESSVGRVRDELGEAKETLINAYTRAKKNELDRYLGFPLLFDGRIRSLDDIRGVHNWKKALDRDLTNPVLSYYPTTPVQELRDRFSLLAPVIVALFDSQGQPRSFEARVSERKNATDGKYFRQLTVTDALAGDISEREYKQIGLDDQNDSVVINKLALSDSIRIAIRKAPGLENDFDVTFSQWGPLEVFRRYQSTLKVEPGNRIWSVQLPVSDASRSGTIVVDFEFAEPLPPLDQWPKSANLKR